MIPEVVNRALQDGSATEVERIIPTAIEQVDSVPFISAFMFTIFNAVSLDYLNHVIEMFAEIDGRLKNVTLCIN